MSVQEAIVVDNTNFPNTGKITVRLKKSSYTRFTLFEYQPDPDEILKKHTDIDVMVATTFGGGNGHGSLKIPSVNEMGLVAFIDDNETRGVWISGIAYPKEYELENGERVKDIFTPNESTKNNSGYFTSRGLKVSSIEDDGFIERIKQTVGQEKNIETVDWNKRETRYLRFLNKDRYETRHYTKWTRTSDGFVDKPIKYQVLSLGDIENKMTFFSSDENSTTEQSIFMDETTISITSIKNDKSSGQKNVAVLEISETGFIDATTHIVGEGTSKLSLGTNSYKVSLKDKRGEVLSSIESNGPNIDLTANNVNINSNTITIGDKKGGKPPLHLLATTSTQTLHSTEGGDIIPLNGQNANINIGNE